MYEYFYYLEHLFIVLELLNDNLYIYNKYTISNFLNTLKFNRTLTSSNISSIRERSSSVSNIPYFNLNRISSITKQLLIALQFMHNNSLIHADIKPENILLNNILDGTVKIIDMGNTLTDTSHYSSYIW
jgi:serine/threonine protein kinase